MDLNSPITVIGGIGEKTADKFRQAGIYTLGDLLDYYPRAYDHFDPPVPVNKAADGMTAAICGFVMHSVTVRYAGKYAIASTVIHDRDKNEISVTWFNMPYLKSVLKPGTWHVFRGVIKEKGKKLTLSQPRIYTPEEYEELSKNLQPVYPLTGALKAPALRRAIKKAFDLADIKEDFLPESVRIRWKLESFDEALFQIHFPADMEHCIKARRRIVFDEFLIFILALKQLKSSGERARAAAPLPESSQADRTADALPYELTNAQKRVWETVRREMKDGCLMSRLIQGDVGSGKTIIAFLALILASENGAQGALMVPTEVLARQHYEAFLSLQQMSGLNIGTVLLTGSVPEREKKEIRRKIKDGTIQVVIGTHALFQEKVEYKSLALVITDEQHRFGVRQRETLSEKGERPHILVMSATPIPRTLAVILYGDLDVSVIDELPAQRLPVKNCVVDTGWRGKAYAFIKKEVQSGHQAYVICPMVEESEMIEAENVTDYALTLREQLGDGISVEILHGKMKSTEKNEIMERFVSGKTDVLVSTTVVEVGVNVPNATVMMIEDAQRFGLAQLHQLRGRVGRSDKQSYCIMIDTSGSGSAHERLKIMNESNDGFKIAEKDLQLRGPGDLFGIRQSGLIEFRMGDIFTDASVLQEANQAAEDIYRKDSMLMLPEHALLREKLLSLTDIGEVKINI